MPEDERVLVSIDRNIRYDEWQVAWMQGMEKETIVSLFAPAYKLDQDCLIVNSKGDLEPRLFDSDNGEAFFQDGFAFKKKFFFDDIDYDWLVHELNKAYVQRQLHPYGVDRMMPESFTEDQVLALKLNRPVAEEDLPDFGGAGDSSEADADKLPFGQKLKGEKTVYTIHQFLGHGYFGYTYSALAHNEATAMTRGNPSPPCFRIISGRCA